MVICLWPRFLAHPVYVGSCVPHVRHDGTILDMSAVSVGSEDTRAYIDGWHLSGGVGSYQPTMSVVLVGVT